MKMEVLQELSRPSLSNSAGRIFKINRSQEEIHSPMFANAVHMARSMGTSKFHRLHDQVDFKSFDRK